MYKRQTYTSSWGAGWYTNDGDNHLSEATIEATAGTFPPLAPLFQPDGVGLEEFVHEPVIISAYPNPFVDQFVVQFNLFESENVQVKLTDISGKTVLTKDFGKKRDGLHYLEIDVPELASGLYIFSLQSGKNVINRRLSKLQ